MAKRISIKHKRREAPEWVFRWRRPGNPVLAKWLAVLVAGGAFAMLLSGVEIRVSQPVRWAAPKATVIHVPDNADGRALRLRAREGGPFPSRFLPSEWDGTAALEQAALGAARWTPPPYVPVLRDLPDQLPPAPVPLASRGEPVFPKRPPPAAVAPAPANLTLVPVIYPLSGIRADEIPRDLPPIDGPPDASVTAETWRFLVRLDAAGHVLDCISLAGGDEVGPPAMEAWLRRVAFKPDPAKSSRWIAVGLGFTNQPSANGTDAD